MRVFILGILLFVSGIISAQDTTSVISLAEYLGYVKTYHPIVKQANLIINESEAKLMKARGAFDPKLEVDYDRKKFKNTEYYDKLNASFKIPTWYGVELKGNFEENDGFYLNPEATVPEDGLYSVGVSVSVAQGFLANKRMTMLKQGKLFVKQAKATGVKFGIWIEPEMVNPKSELYEKHPDWVIRQPDRPEKYYRNQLVLDLSNPEVQDFVFGIVDTLFTKNPELAFVKWDCNAVIYNAYSAYLNKNKKTQILPNIDFAVKESSEFFEIRFRNKPEYYNNKPYKHFSFDD